MFISKYEHDCRKLDSKQPKFPYRNKLRRPSVTARGFKIPFPFFPAFCQVCTGCAACICGTFSFSSHCLSETVDHGVILLWLTLFALEVRKGGVMILCPSWGQLFRPFNVANLRRVSAGLPLDVYIRDERFSIESFCLRISFSSWPAASRDVAASSTSGSALDSLELCSVREYVTFCVSLSTELSSSVVLFRLAMLPDRLVKLLVMLATLSFRIIEWAEARTRCSLLAWPAIPGNGRISRVQTSARRLSSLTRSERAGARTGIRLVVRSDCDLLMEAGATSSLETFVFLMMTWQSPDIGSTVVALCIDILLAMVPSRC